jgi:hypothetical protein
MKYEEKIKLVVQLFRARSTNSLAESQKQQIQRRHSMTRTDLHCWHRSGGGRALYLRASDIRAKPAEVFR